MSLSAFFMHSSGRTGAPIPSRCLQFLVRRVPVVPEIHGAPLAHLCFSSSQSDPLRHHRGSFLPLQEARSTLSQVRRRVAPLGSCSTCTHRWPVESLQLPPDQEPELLLLTADIRRYYDIKEQQTWTSQMCYTYTAFGRGHVPQQPCCP